MNATGRQTHLRTQNVITTFEEFHMRVKKYAKFHRVFKWIVTGDLTLKISKQATWTEMVIPDEPEKRSSHFWKQVWEQLPERLYFRIAFFDAEMGKNIQLANCIRVNKIDDADAMERRAIDQQRMLTGVTQITNQTIETTSKSLKEITQAQDNLASARERIERQLTEKERYMMQREQWFTSELRERDKEIQALRNHNASLQQSQSILAGRADAVTLGMHSAMSVVSSWKFGERLTAALESGKFTKEQSEAIELYMQINTHLSMMPENTRNIIEKALMLFKLPTERTMELVEMINFMKRIMDLPEDQRMYLLDKISDGSVDALLNSVLQTQKKPGGFPTGVSNTSLVSKHLKVYNVMHFRLPRIL